MGFAESLVAPGAALGGVLITMIYSGRRDRLTDARARRDARRTRLAESYRVMLHAAVGTSDLLRQIEKVGVTPSPEVLARWNSQIKLITQDIDRAQIALMLDETDPEATKVLTLSFQIARLWADAGPADPATADPAAVAKKVQETHAAVHPLAEAMRKTMREHLAKLEQPLPRAWLR